MVIVFLNRGASAFLQKGPRRRVSCVLAFCIALWVMGVLECARTRATLTSANPCLKLGARATYRNLVIRAAISSATASFLQSCPAAPARATAREVSSIFAYDIYSGTTSRRWPMNISMASAGYK